MPDDYVPINISLNDRRVLVVGGGRVALRKIEMLLDYNPDLTVIAPEAVDKIEYFAGKGRLRLEKREYRSPEASQYGLVVSAADDRAVNEQVHDDCRRSGVLVNVVDCPRLCTFIVPAVVKRDSLTISVSTGGKAPFLARFLRMLLDDAFPLHYAKVTRFAHSFRQDVNKRFKGQPERKAQCFERFLATDWKKVIKTLSDEEIRLELSKMLEE